MYKLLIPTIVCGLGMLFAGVPGALSGKPGKQPIKQSGKVMVGVACFAVLQGLMVTFGLANFGKEGAPEPHESTVKMMAMVGPMWGTQYRSGAYYFDDEQQALIEASKAAYEGAMKAKGFGPITTEVAAASDYTQLFYYGEDYHQQYLAKPGARPYCSAQPRCVSLPPFESWCPPGLEHHAPKLPEAFWAQHGPKPHCVINSPNEPIVWMA